MSTLEIQKSLMAEVDLVTLDAYVSKALLLTGTTGYIMGVATSQLFKTFFSIQIAYLVQAILPLAACVIWFTICGASNKSK